MVKIDILSVWDGVRCLIYLFVYFCLIIGNRLSGKIE